MTLKNCKLCGPKTIDQFYISYISKSGNPVYKEVCKVCFNKRQKDNKSPERDKRRLLKIAINRASGIGRSADLLRSYKRSDKINGRCCDLTKEFIESYINKGCTYCGEKDICLIGLDRIDNTLGHLKMNVVSACQRCNILRRDMPYEAWLLFVPVIKEAISRGFFNDWHPRQVSNKHLDGYVLQDNRCASILTTQIILDDADKFFQLHGVWPNTSRPSNTVPGKPNETWTNYDIYLNKGYRGLPGGSSLAKLLNKERGVQNKRNRPLTQDIIWEDIKEFYKIHGKYPNKREKLPVPNKPFETWSGYSSALYFGTRGVIRGSLNKLIKERSKGIV